MWLDVRVINIIRIDCRKNRISLISFFISHKERITRWDTPAYASTRARYRKVERYTYVPQARFNVRHFNDHVYLSWLDRSIIHKTVARRTQELHTFVHLSPCIRHRTAACTYVRLLKLLSTYRLSFQSFIFIVM